MGMKDVIDERNRLESMKKSIIKFWNVQYVSAESANQMPQQEEQIKEELPEEKFLEIQNEKQEKLKHMIEQGFEEKR